MKAVISVISFILLAASASAARIDTLKVFSDKMERDINVVVIVPDTAGSGSRCPSLYLLHGYGGNELSWLGIRPDLPRMSDEDGVIVICPYGENSWYWDSPNVETSQFETFVSKELPAYIDRNYPTKASRESRAITGLSMGGHGALWLAIRNKDVFGAAGSTSGGVDIRPFPENWDMAVQLGPYSRNREVWDSHTVMTQLEKISNGDLAIIFDCGTDDFFYKVNLELHEKMLDKGIAHDFISRPGAHTSEYWGNAIRYQWLFFCTYFRNAPDA